jgi:hypothetical protein
MEFLFELQQSRHEKAEAENRWASAASKLGFKVPDGTGKVSAYAC